MPLTDEQLAELKVWAMPGFLAYHNEVLPESDRIDPEAYLSVLKDLRLVAAEMLEVVCLDLGKADAESRKRQLKRIKDGSEELEFFQGESALAAQAGKACERAAWLRGQVNGIGFRPLPSPLATMRSGSNPTPVFTIPRPEP